MGKNARSIPVQLAHVVLDINREFERAVTDEHASLLAWALALRVIPEGGLDLPDFALAARISRRAAKSLLRWRHLGLLAVDDKHISLTDEGRRVRDRWGGDIIRIEKDWSARVPAAKALRGALEAVVAKFELEHPNYPVIYGPSDWSAIGGSAVKAKPPHIPAHGSDWAPALRTDTTGIEDLPLFALASQALMAFTIDYEEGNFPMAPAAIIGRALPTGSAPMDTLPRILSVDGSGKSALERHGIVRVTGSGSKRVATLTRLGVLIRDAYEPVVERTTRDWHERFGTELSARLSDVDGQLSDDLPDYVLVRHSVSFGYRDISFD